MSRQDTHTKSTRRRHAVAFKRELIERSLQPGASVSGIALENGVNANVLFRWRREHLRACSSAPHESTGQAVLLPVKLAATVMPTTQEATTPRSPNSLMPAGVIEIDIGAARVRLRGAVDDGSLRCVLQVLRTCT